MQKAACDGGSMSISLCFIYSSMWLLPRVSWTAFLCSIWFSPFSEMILKVPFPEMQLSLISFWVYWIQATWKYNYECGVNDMCTAWVTFIESKWNMDGSDFFFSTFKRLVSDVTSTNPSTRIYGRFPLFSWIVSKCHDSNIGPSSWSPLPFRKPATRSIHRLSPAHE